MPYKSLYSRRQAEAAYLPRSWYVADAQQLQWVRNIVIKVSSELDKNAVRGMIIRKTAEMHGGIPRFDYHIYVAENMTPEMERFVVIKELMHCYFGPTPENIKYATDNAIILETHARQIFGDSAISPNSPHVKAERMGLWMAVGVLCPEHVRTTFTEQLAAKTTDLQQIAADLKIPPRQAYNLTSKQYEDEIANILN